jgi:hypothetical protein
MEKRQITNTSREEIHPEWLFGRNPNAIEEQEKRGQQELCEASELPKKINRESGRRFEDAREFYESMNFKVEEKEGDDLFYRVSFPDGWKIKPLNNHPMWNQLVNPKGEMIAQIFYKAAFYDRDAFINIIEKL